MINGVFRDGKALLEMFDEKFYRERIAQRDEEIPDDLFVHFMETGWKDGHNPSPEFDLEFYLTENEDVQNIDLNPLFHYFKFGQYEGRRPNSDARRTGLLTPHGLRIWFRLTAYVDHEFYVSQLECDGINDIDPLMHYFAFGHRSKLAISPDFSPRYYTETNADIARGNQDPLLHYLQYGHLEGRKSSPDGNMLPLDEDIRRQIDVIRPVLDPAFYLEQTPQLHNTTVDPANHFYFFGLRSDFDPNSQFSTVYHFKLFPCPVDERNTNFVHHIESGNLRNVKATPTGYDLLENPGISDGQLSSLDLAKGFVPFDSPEIPDVYVLISFLAGHSDALASLYAVLNARTQRRFKILVLNDHPESSDLSKKLQQYASQYNLGYMLNTSSIGAARTVNKGLQIIDQLAPSNALILDSNTVVYDEWIDRMLAYLDSNEGIATVTPLSNSGTLSSYPVSFENNCYDIEISHEEISRIALTSTVEPVDILTGSRLAMLISQKALKKLGPLDADAFGQGYGEDIDFCQRARQSGLRNIAAPDVYVSRLNSIPSRLSQDPAYIQCRKVLFEKYPEYELSEFDFINGDPLLLARQHLDIERLIKFLKFNSFIVTLSHNFGGGTEKYIKDIRAVAIAEDLSVVQITILNPSYCKISVHGSEGLLILNNLESLHYIELEAILSRCIELDTFRYFFLNSILNAGQTLQTSLSAVARRASDKLITVIHDFAVDCPRANYTNSIGQYCGGNQSVKICINCLHGEMNSPNLDIAEWRHVHRDILQHSRTVIVPDVSVIDHLPNDLRNTLPVHVIPHGEPGLSNVKQIKPRPIGLRSHPRRLAILGAIGIHKGSRILRAMRDDIIRRNIGLELHLIGYSDLKDLADDKVIFSHGAYSSEAEALKRFTDIGLHGALSLSVWPETYSYTLSILMAAGLPTIGFNIGAQGHRLEQYERGVPVALEIRHRISCFVDLIMDIDLEELWSRPVNHNRFPVYKTLSDYLTSA